MSTRSSDINLIVFETLFYINKYICDVYAINLIDYIVIHIFLLISMENNRAIYPCICSLIKNTNNMYIALVQI